MSAMQLHWDIFCRVVDNYGDIGVCWRLARQLACEHARKVRLWVDDLDSLKPLLPTIDPVLQNQSCDGVDICQWIDSGFTVDGVADVVIEAFACELPPAYLQQMAINQPRPCWVNLEYLTAEPWAGDYHGMASPHPSLPLTKYFFFPGFEERTGGLLREVDWLRRFKRTSDNLNGALTVSLFCYDSAPVAALLAVLAEVDRPIRCLVAPGKPLSAVRGVLGSGDSWKLGLLSVESMPFLPLDEYDAFLASCDLNFVRGEDSFVRAQWAGVPFVWQAYPQADNVHLDKLDAFLDRYCAGASCELTEVVRRLFVAWNADGDLSGALVAYLQALAALRALNEAWRDKLAAQPDLATALVNFCHDKL